MSQPDREEELCLPTRRKGRRPNIDHLAAAMPRQDRTADQIGRSYTREQIEKLEAKKLGRKR